MRRWMLGTIFLFCLTLLLADGEGTKYDLRLKFQKGEKLYYETVEKNTEKSAFAQGEQKTSSESVMELNVEDVAEDGTATVTSRILRLKLSTPKGEFDSEKEEESTLPESDKKACKTFLTHSLKAKVAPKGEVKDVQGIEEMMKEMEGMIKEQLEQVPEAMRGTVEEMRKKMLKENIKKSAAWFPYLPEKEVAVGEKWEFEQKKMMATIRWENTLKEVVEKEGKQIAVIVMELKELTPDTESNPFAAMLEIVDAKGEGRLELNITDGKIVSMKQKVSFGRKHKMMNQMIGTSSTEGTLKLLKEPPKKEAPTEEKK